MQHDLGASVTASPVDTHEVSPLSQNGRKRKAASNTSRGVASLTPDQLAKKRANDREAQRAIRERTKQQIDNLERRIQELTSQQPYQELQAVIRQKDAVQAENDEIRRRLASIMSIIQPIVGAQGLTDLATAAQQNVQLGLASQNDGFQTDQYLDSHTRPYPSQSPQTAVREGPAFPPYSPVEDVPNGENRVLPASRDALDHQRDNIHRSLELESTGERLSFSFLLDSLGQKASIPQVQHASSTPRSPYPPLSNTFAEQNHPTWSMLPKNTTPTCPLDSVLLNFLQARRREANNGTVQNLASPAYPSVSSLLNPTSTDVRADPLSQLMTDIVSKFPSISALPEQCATVFFMFITIRWMLNPTQENYERIPEWLTPRPSQLFTPHPAWIDHLPWPRMRDKLVHSYQDYVFENWFIPFTTGLSVNWPYEPIDCLLSTSEKDEPIINPVFERHIMRLENWSLGPAFAETFPALADTAPIKENNTGRTEEQQ